MQAYMAARQRLIDALPGDFENVVKFNDSPLTAHPDVLALFDRAIGAAE